MLLLSEKFEETVARSTLFIDTNIFINAQVNEELRKFLIDLKNKPSSSKTAIVTLRAVLYEYTRGSQSLNQLKSRHDFVELMTDDILSMSKIVESSDKNNIFSLVMSLTTSKKNSQYTDFILASMLNMFSSSSDDCYILSSDSRAFSDEIFNVVGTIFIDKSVNDKRHLYLIELDIQKYNNLIQDKVS